MNCVVDKWLVIFFLSPPSLNYRITEFWPRLPSTCIRVGNDHRSRSPCSPGLCFSRCEELTPNPLYPAACLSDRNPVPKWFSVLSGELTVSLNHSSTFQKMVCYYHRHFSCTISQYRNTGADEKMQNPLLPRNINLTHAEKAAGPTMEFIWVDHGEPDHMR